MDDASPCLPVLERNYEQEAEIIGRRLQRQTHCSNVTSLEVGTVVLFKENVSLEEPAAADRTELGGEDSGRRSSRS